MPDAPIDLRADPGAVPIRRDVVTASGPEAVAFLQGQLSQDVDVLGHGQSAWSLLLQPTGKVDGWLRVTRLDDDRVLLDVEAGAGEAVLARLSRFKLRTKADLELATWDGYALRGAASSHATPDGALALAAPWPGVDGIDVLGPTATEPDLPVVGAETLEALRIEAGVPSMGAEITEDTIPAELGQWLIDASVSFTKGCYTGQELVARIDSRGGKVPRPVRGLVLTAEPPAVGEPVQLAGKDVGRITSSARSVALGAIALAPVARSVEVGTQVEVAGQPAEVRELPLR